MPVPCSSALSLTLDTVFTIGAAAVGLAYGCVQMVRETGLAVRNLSEEAQLSGAGQ